MIATGIHPSAIMELPCPHVVPESTVVEPGCVFYFGPEAGLTLGENNIFYPNCALRAEHGQITTGREVSFGPGCNIYEPRAGLSIGDHTMIGGGTCICGVNHGHELLDMPMRRQPVKAAPVVIGDDVWVGMGVSILPGVTIGSGSIIAAGAVVTRSIPPMSVAMGVPCAVVRQRGEDHDR